MRSLLLLLVVVGLAACDSASPITLPGETTLDGVIFRVDRTQVQRGGTVELALVNESDRVLETGVFGCAGIERRDGDTWVVRQEDNDRACILPLYVFDPGQTYRGAFQFDVSPGTVRLVHTFVLRGAERTSTIRSAPIQVIR